MEHAVDVSTQTDPVVVLSLAQAAVLGLISQNEIFGATIAPNGFYTGEGRAPPAESMEYEYADQLIGANGDYLAEPHGENRRPGRLYGVERRRPGPRGRIKRPLGEGAPEESMERSPNTLNQVKGERPEFSSPCYLSNPQQPDDEPEVLDLAPQRVPMKEEQCNKGYPEPSSEPAIQQVDTDTQTQAHQSPVGHGKTLVESSEGGRGKEEEQEEDEEEVEERALNLKTTEEDVSPSMRRYYESSVTAYEAAEMACLETMRRVARPWCGRRVRIPWVDGCRSTG